MKPTQVLAGVVVLFGAAWGATVAGGCGQSVATCGSVCSLASNVATTDPGSEGCVTACTTLQTKCGTGSYAADFQAYLTCRGNEGAATPSDGECTAITTLVTRECNGITPQGSGTGSTTSSTSVIIGPPTSSTITTFPPSTSNGSSNGGGLNAPCAELQDCCPLLPTETSQSMCFTIASTDDASSCGNNLLEAESAGYCGGGGASSGTGGLSSNGSLADACFNLEECCPSFGQGQAKCEAIAMSNDAATCQQVLDEGPPCAVATSGSGS